MSFRGLTAEQARSYLDVRDQFDALREARSTLAHSFAGSMHYQRRGEHEYLLHKRSGSNASLGRRSGETDEIKKAFAEGKARLQGRVSALRSAISERAPVLAALGMGRLPRTQAKVLRRLDEQGWLGERLVVVGTNALYAYEAAAAVHIQGGQTATVDLDVLLDARRRMTLRGATSDGGLIALLRKADKSFAPRGANDFRAVSDAGFLVDLIEPQRRDWASCEASRLSDAADDLTAAPIAGLAWLESSPRFEAVVLDEKGLPCWLPTIDPRAFALHKHWLASKQDRDPAKRRRDAAQAATAATLAVRHLGLDLEGSDLTALPAALRAGAGDLLAQVPPPEADW